MRLSIRKSIALIIMLALNIFIAQAMARFVPSPIERLPALSMMDQNAEQQRLDQQAGRISVVNFWATWCAPCVHELPTLAALGHHYADTELQVILVNEDIQFEKAKAFLADFDFPDDTMHLFDQGGKYLQAIQGRGLPVTLIVDAKGHVRHFAQGDADWNSPEVHNLIEDLRKEVPHQQLGWWRSLWNLF